MSEAMNITEMMENYNQVKLSQSNREVIREALEMFRNHVTLMAYGDTESHYDGEYLDIMLDEVDEILQFVEEKE